MLVQENRRTKTNAADARPTGERFMTLAVG